jgi:hypothetical protein
MLHDRDLGLQEMVPRAELLSAVSEVEALRVENRSSQSKVAALEAEVELERANVARAASEAGKVRSAQLNMVPKSELAEVLAQFEAARAKAAAAEREHIRSAEELVNRVAALEAEKTGLLAAMQVMAVMQTRMLSLLMIDFGLEAFWC